MAKPIAKLYFTKGNEPVALDLAARIRNEGNYCHLIYGNLFSGPNDVQDDAHAIAIQADNNKASFIARTYKKERPEVEVHFFNKDGEFCDAPEHTEPEKTDPFAKVKAAAAPLALPEAEEPAPADDSDAGSDDSEDATDEGSADAGSDEGTVV